MRIEVWSDIVCPFCTIGNTELDKALASFPHADQVEVVPRSFELHPNAAVEPIVDYLTRKYGWPPAQLEAQTGHIADRAAGLGLDYNWRAAISAPTRDAHRLVKLAATVGLARETEMALMLAHFTDARDVSDHSVLAEVAGAVGLDGDRVAEVLGGDEFSAEVAADQRQAGLLGVAGTPFFLIDGKYGVSGAQPAEVLGQALTQVWALTHPVVDLGFGVAGEVCGPDGCA